MREFLARWRTLLNWSWFTPFIEFYNMLVRHMGGVVAWAGYRLTDAALEGSNSRSAPLANVVMAIANPNNLMLVLYPCVLEVARRGITRMREEGEELWQWSRIADAATEFQKRWISTSREPSEHGTTWDHWPKLAHPWISSRVQTRLRLGQKGGLSVAPALGWSREWASSGVFATNV